VLAAKLASMLSAHPFLKNIFRFNEGKAEDLVMLDFQCTRLSSPAIDLVYCLVTGTRAELRQVHLKEWLNIYHCQFTSDLKAFGFDANTIYPMEKLVQDFETFYSYGFAWGMQHCGVSIFNNICMYRLWVDHFYRWSVV
jgi:hypothetical protein